MNSEIIENVKMNLKKGLEFIDKLAIARGFEIWRPIENYDNEVSNLGRVRNTKNLKLRRAFLHKSGYAQIGLSKHGIEKKFKVHRLVAIAFIHNPENKAAIDHIDNNTLNNTVTNLRWATTEENNQNSSLRKDNMSGTKGVYLDKRSKKWVASISKDKKRIYIGLFENIEDAKEARQKKSLELFGLFQNHCEK